MSEGSDVEDDDLDALGREAASDLAAEPAGTCRSEGGIVASAKVTKSWCSLEEGKNGRTHRR